MLLSKLPQLQLNLVLRLRSPSLIIKSAHFTLSPSLILVDNSVSPLCYAVGLGPVCHASSLDGIVVLAELWFFYFCFVRLPCGERFLFTCSFPNFKYILENVLEFYILNIERIFLAKSVALYNTMPRSFFYGTNV